jgi:hypothetical protein
VVKFFYPNLGYGFITTPTGEDIFVHQNDIKMDGLRALSSKFLVLQKEKFMIGFNSLSVFRRETTSRIFSWN